MVPPSIWSKDGKREPLVFPYANGHCPVPDFVEAEKLTRKVVLSAIGMILAKHLGLNGFGHDARLAWAGFLLRLGLTRDELVTMGETMSPVCNNREIHDVRTVVESTANALERGNQKVVGGPHLAKLIGRERGAAVIERVREFLGKGTQQSVELLCAAEVKMEKLDWLWPARLVRGGITLLEGRPEVGKSTVLINFAARVSRGHSFPGQKTTREPGAVVMLIAEDDLGATVVPRLVAAGADLTKIFFLNLTKNENGEIVPFQLTDDCDRLRAKCEEVGAVMVVVDPLVSYLGSRRKTVNTYNDLEVRQALAPLRELASQTRAAVVAIRHYRKGAGTDAIEAGGGSIAFAALVRVIIAAIPDPEDEDGIRYLLAVAKNNLVKRSERPAFSYEIVPWDSDPDIGRITWGQMLDQSANEIFARSKEVESSSKGKVGEAKEFLTKLLAGGAQIPSKEVVSAAKANGISEAALHRARKEMSIVVEKQGAGWSWREEPVPF